MMHFQPMRTVSRAPRVNLRGSVSATIYLENRRQFTARLHQLSLTGGLLELASYIDERTRIGLALQIRSAPIIARADLLFPMRGGMGYLQPFRFIGFGAGVLQTLDIEIAALLKHAAVPVRSGHGSGLRLPRFVLDSF
jgi:hypothetical protein